MRALGMMPLLALSCATASEPLPKQALWCQQGFAPDRTPWVELSDFELKAVTPAQLSKAIRSLRARTAIALTRDEAKRLLAAPAEIGEGRYYLVRGGVYAPAGATSRQIVEATRSVTYELAWFPDSRHLVVMGLQPTPVPVELVNVALVLKADIEVSAVFVSCYPIR